MSPAVRTKKLKVEPIKSPDLVETKNAQIVFENAIKSMNEFYAAYQLGRSGSRGTTTHQQQDLLRAMLVFACSGLDAVIKQLIKDALPLIIDNDIGAQQEFQKYIERTLRKQSGEKTADKDTINLDTKFLAKILSSSQPRAELVILRLKDLNADSLQSRDQILKVATCFAIVPQAILDDSDTTKSAFEARNQIIHEMDVDLSGKKKRRQRQITVMVRHCENISNIAAKFINTVGDKINGAK